jgi:hypothetical protein
MPYLVAAIALIVAILLAPMLANLGLSGGKGAQL